MLFRCGAFFYSNSFDLLYPGRIRFVRMCDAFLLFVILFGAYIRLLNGACVFVCLFNYNLTCYI